MLKARTMHKHVTSNIVWEFSIAFMAVVIVALLVCVKYIPEEKEPSNSSSLDGQMMIYEYGSDSRLRTVFYVDTDKKEEVLESEAGLRIDRPGHESMRIPANQYSIRWFQ